jgi:hypothetical protein
MSREIKRIDITSAPDFLALVEEVRASNEPRVLTRNGEDIAVVQPVRKRRSAKQPSPEDIAVSMSAAGSWKGLINAEQFKRRIYASRGSKRPPVKHR